ncbi:hypothetical protein LTR53_018801, partial [Teratosphaeriaceae sp. CCFEE 6253]
MHVAGLSSLIASSVQTGARIRSTIFEPGQAVDREQDALATLSPESHHILLRLLARRDVANLRLASPCFRQLPQSYFRRLVETEMPWVWELSAQQGKPLDWHALWCKLHAADGGSGLDEKYREETRRENEQGGGDLTERYQAFRTQLVEEGVGREEFNDRLGKR